jgi:tRNA (guanosine-2'-O-)-methyltransferase
MDRSPRFPHDGSFRFGEHTLDASQLLELLGPMMTEERRATLRDVAATRSYEITTVCEGLYDRGNVSAVLRTAEGLGYPAVHIVDNQPDFKPANRVAQGADKWLDLWRYDAAEPCIERLRARGYRIVATHLEASRPLADFDFTEPTALVFGNEHAGVSQAFLEAADARCIIPMPGFTQSFNISVAAAVSLYHAFCQRTERRGRNGDLDEERQRILEAVYALRSVPRAREVVRHTLDRRGADSE